MPRRRHARLRTASFATSRRWARGPRTRTWPARDPRRYRPRKRPPIQRQHHRQRRHDAADASFSPSWCVATGDARYRAAFERGVDYLLAAQYPNGGWPQFFPLREGYYSRITYNDNAMVHVLTVLRDAAAGKPPYAFVDDGPARQGRAPPWRAASTSSCAPR